MVYPSNFVRRYYISYDSRENFFFFFFCPVTTEVWKQCALLLNAYLLLLSRYTPWSYDFPFQSRSPLIIKSQNKTHVKQRALNQQGERHVIAMETMGKCNDVNLRLWLLNFFLAPFEIHIHCYSDNYTYKTFNFWIYRIFFIHL